MTNTTNAKKVIFIVDDNKTNLVVAGEALAERYKVITLDSGARLLTMLEKLRPHLILLDVRMPDLDGYEVIQRLKADFRFEDIPVIFLTALNASEDEFHGLELGATDYIQKPFFPPLLLRRIEMHLNLLDYQNHLQDMVNEKLREVVELKNAVLKTTAELVEFRDATTGNHIERTQLFLRLLLEAMTEHDVYAAEIASFDIDLVVQSSQLHDVGKISLRDDILLKAGPLTPEERLEMQKHAIKGEEIILTMKQNTRDQEYLEYARIFAVSHHEKWDGTGYPHQLAGDAIPLLGRVMAIADVYDALVTVRPYKKAFSHEDAVAIIVKDRGTHFDPRLIDLFLKIHPDFERVSRENV